MISEVAEEESKSVKEEPPTFASTSTVPKTSILADSSEVISAKLLEELETPCLETYDLVL